MVDGEKCIWLARRPSREQGSPSWAGEITRQVVGSIDPTSTFSRQWMVDGGWWMVNHDVYRSVERRWERSRL